MAFQPNAAVAPAQTNDSWKAQAFLNMYIKRADGSKAKVGALAFKANKKFDAALIKRFQEEGGLQAFADAVIFDFQMAESDTPVDAGF
jgi:hypothetical protein